MPELVEKTNAAKFENGSSRSHHAPRYELLPKAAIDRLVSRLERGAEIHGANNWRGGGPKFIEQTRRHLAEHVLNYLEGDTSDDHLGAVLCNAAFLAHFEAMAKNELIRCTRCEQLMALLDDEVSWVHADTLRPLCADQEITA